MERGPEEFDVVGVGFGPSGIALACAVEDRIEADGHGGLGRVCFVERNPDSAWHREMLLPDTDVQHHFLRDLATPRDPRSRFTFCNYLKEKNRLYEFGELAFGTAGGAVSRLEWSDYLMWAAAQLRGYVRYSEEVLGIYPVRNGSRCHRLALVTTRGALSAEALVLCAGRKAVVPEPFANRMGPTIFHSSGFRRFMGGFGRDRDWRFAVVGSGQSAVEVLIFLHGGFPSATLVSVQRAPGFRHVDLCQFSNTIFHPPNVDFFHALGAEERRCLLDEAKSTNYGVVDAQAADILYRKWYEDMVVGTERIRFFTRSRVVSATDAGGRHRLRVENTYTGSSSEVDVDAVILCTGYEEERFPAVLEPLADLIPLDETGGVRVARDYRVVTKDELEVPIYLSGMSERTHGISDAASFSMVALRAKAVLDSLVQRGQRPRRAPGGE